jgi:transcriptional regulator with XRE-family HTH domain
MSPLGSKIRARRLAKGLTQQDVCRLAGVSRPSVIAAEQGKPLQTAVLQKILAVLDLDLDVTDLSSAAPLRNVVRPAVEPARRGQRFPTIRQLMARVEKQGGYA